MFARLSLKTKFIIMTTVAIVLLTSAIGYIAVTREEEILYREAEKRGRLLGETLAIPIVNDLIYERLGVVEEGGLLDTYLQEIFRKKDADILYLAVLDEEGRVISHNDIMEYGKVYRDPVTTRALGADGTTIQKFTDGGQDALDVAVPLAIGMKRWGTLKVALSLASVERETQAMIIRIALIALVLLAGSFVAILLLSRRFISPITELANTMEMTGGDFLNAKVAVKGHDEIALLGERFNSMIDRIRQANEEIRKAHEKLVQSEKLSSIGILASGVAHEINNPLGGLFNCLRMLTRDGDNPEFREKYLGLVREGLERIENTVGKLLWMARKSEHVPVEVNVRNTVESVRSLTDYQLKKAQVQVLNEIPGNLMVIADVNDMQQMLLNLFINAIHAMRTGGVLTVNGRRTNGQVELAVVDTGGGIPKEHIAQVFDPFFTTKPPGEGTGLGLWLTYEIVKAYGGEIAVKSEEGRGTTFTLTFPVATGS